MLRGTNPSELSSHYTRLGRSIRNLADPQQRTWFYDQEFEQKVMEAMVRELDAAPGHRVVKQTSNRLHSRLGLECPIVCVDPSSAMMDNHPLSTSTITSVLSSALEFSARPGESYDRLYVCEAVHHFGSRHDLAKIFRGISRQLKKGGRIVIEKPSKENGTLPLVKGKKPCLFRARGQRPVSTEEITGLLSADFEEVRVVRVHHVLNLEMRWMKDAIRMRYHSWLSALTDAEIEAGVARLEEEHAGAEYIQWPINKDLISAKVRD